jgi:hypothetical protein
VLFAVASVVFDGGERGRLRFCLPTPVGRDGATFVQLFCGAQGCQCRGFFSQMSSDDEGCAHRLRRRFVVRYGVIFLQFFCFFFTDVV